MRGSGEVDNDGPGGRVPLLQGTLDSDDVASAAAVEPHQPRDSVAEDNFVSASYHPGDSVAQLHSLHCSHEGYRHALISATCTLGLGCLGSSILPMPYAFSKTGLVVGFLLMGVVAWANAFTAKMLLHAAASTHSATYEACAEAVGGPAWKVAVQVSLLVLLFGNTCGSLSLLGDVGGLALQHYASAPAWLTAAGVQMLLVVFLVFPLCLLRDIRSLDRCAPGATAVVASLVCIIIGTSVSEGLPAVRSGDLPLFIPTDTLSLPEAVSLLGFAFYLHPCLIPVLREMPPGRLGLRGTITATRIVLYGVCIAVYGTVGFFGAARFGLETKGDVLENDVLSGGFAVALIGAIAAYLAVSVPPIFHVLRTSFTQLAAPGADFSWVRHTLETIGLLAAAMVVALFFSNAAEKIFAITGATGVCMACYVLPVMIYRRERSNASRRFQESSMEMLPGHHPPPKQLSSFENIMSGTVTVVGVATSLLALWSSAVRS